MKENHKKRMLVVDDEYPVLLAYKQLFKGEKIDVDISDNLGSADKFLNNNLYDVVISDLELTEAKDKEGLSIIRKAREVNPESLLIVVTAYGNKAIKDMLFEAGANYYYEKPLSVGTIKKVLAGAGIIH